MENQAPGIFIYTEAAAMPDPLTGASAGTRAIAVRFLTCSATVGTPSVFFFVVFS